MGLRSGTKGKDAFVVVSYDFEYITEEGKEVIVIQLILLYTADTFRTLHIIVSSGVDERGRGAPASI